MNDRELLEPVEVVGYLNTATDEVVKYGPTLMDWDDEQEPVEPLMTVEQHKRLMAAKDGDAVKVPRELLERVVKPVLFTSQEDSHYDACTELRVMLGGEA